MKKNCLFLVKIAACLLLIFLTAQTTVQHHTFEKDPIELLTSSSFDVTAKCLYAKARKRGVQNAWAKKLYLESIRVINGFREYFLLSSGEQVETKQSPEDYIRTFHSLLDSIKEKGFKPDELWDPTQPFIPLDHKNQLLGGAHRTAACIIHKKVAICEIWKDYKSHDFSSKLLKQRNLAKKYLDAMALEYCTLKKNTYIVAIMPAALGLDREIESILNTYGTIVYEKKVMLNQRGALNFVLHAYRRDPWIGTWSNNFADARYKTNCSFPQDHRKKNPMRVFLIESESLEQVKACKKKIRALFGINNYSVHINDTHEETIDLARTLFVDNSIHCLNNAKLKNFEKFHSYLARYKKWLTDNNVDPDCFCVDGSAIMSAYGLRDCRDLDFLHHGYDNLSTNDRCLGDHNTQMHHHTKTKDEIIFNPENHFWYQGVKFASLEVLREMKHNRNASKDRPDVQMMDGILKKGKL